MKRRIAIISEHASPLATLGGTDCGGQNVYVGQVAARLAAMGHHVDVFTRRERPDQPEIAPWRGGARVIHVPAGPAMVVPKEELLPCMSDFTSFVLGCCRRERYDVIHANFWMSGLVAAEIRRALGIPFLITFHALGRVRRMYQGSADRFPDARFTIEERVVAEADRIIAECPQDRDDLITLYGADAEKIRIIPCGFDEHEFWPMPREEARGKIGVASDEFLMVQIGRMVRRKGVETVVRGFARMRRQCAVPARLLIVGGESDEPDPRVTPEIGRLQRIAAEEGVGDTVTFVGRRGRDMLRYYYSAADVFVSTPWYEPFGITPVEAMACGTPVIGSSVGGIKYTVVDDVTGNLVPPNDPEALADRAARLASNPKLREAFRRAAIRRARARFTWRNVTLAIAELCEEVIGHRERRRRGRVAVHAAGRRLAAAATAAATAAAEAAAAASITLATADRIVPIHGHALQQAVLLDDNITRVRDAELARLILRSDAGTSGDDTILEAAL